MKKAFLFEPGRLAGKRVNMEIAKLVVDLVSSLTNLILDAFDKKDPAKLKKVTDVLTDEPLKTRAELVMQREIAKDAFGVDDD